MSPTFFPGCPPEVLTIEMLEGRFGSPIISIVWVGVPGAVLTNESGKAKKGKETRRTREGLDHANVELAAWWGGHGARHFGLSGCL